MDRETLKFVIVGHIDHGKSTLIGRLMVDTRALATERIEEIERQSAALGRTTELAFATDHLEEERGDAMTIDTAQAFFHTPKRDYVVIDAPGHKEFIRNMITGASQAEAALLVIDAAEGIREQTRRHATLLSMLGVRQLAVLVNKMDKVDWSRERFAAVADEFVRFLGGLSLEPRAIIPISASLGENIISRSAHMPWHTGPTVIETLDSFVVPESLSSKPMRFPVQDVYDIGGRRVIAGRVESGTVVAGDPVVILPVVGRSHVKSVERFLSPPADRAEAGLSIGITLEDDAQVRRGDVIACIAEPPRVVAAVTANVFWMATPALERGERLILRLATQDVPVTAAEIRTRIDSSTLETIAWDAPQLRESEVGSVNLRAERPFVAESFAALPEMGRFVLVRGNDIVAGGIIPEIP